MQNDLTTGSVFRNVLSFSLPYLLSYFLQTLYGMADLFIIGQFEGVASTTAVSIGSQVMHMLTVMLVGLAMGATVSIAQAAGGGDKKRTASAIGNTVTLFMLLSLALTALLLVSSSCPHRRRPCRARSPISRSALSVFRSSRRTTSSPRSSAALVTARAPCTSSPWPASSTSRSTTTSWARCTSAPRARRSAPRSRRR